MSRADMVIKAHQVEFEAREYLREIAQAAAAEPTDWSLLRLLLGKARDDAAFIARMQRAIAATDPSPEP